MADKKTREELLEQARLARQERLAKRFGPKEEVEEVVEETPAETEEVVEETPVVEEEQPVEETSEVEEEVEEEETEEEPVEEPKKTKKAVKEKKMAKTEKKETPKKVVKKEEPVEKNGESPRNYHISKRQSDGKWQVKFANGQKAIKLFDTQKEAIEFAQQLADSKDGKITIHKVDGKIRKQNYSKK